MGTNYYVYAPELAEQGLSYIPCNLINGSFRHRNFTVTNHNNGKHFGKRSAGWDFALHVYPNEGIRSLEDWLVLLSDKKVEIRDDSGRKIKLKHLLRIVLRGEGTALSQSFGGPEDAVLNPFTQRCQPPPDNDYCYAIFPSYFCRDHDFG